MEKKNMIMGIIAAVVVVACLVGLKFYQGSTATPGQGPGQPAAMTAPSDPYASYSAPSSQQ